MTTYSSYDLVEYGMPLKRREHPLPAPEGAQVLVRITRAGVCHSDIHIAEGFFDLGEEGRMTMSGRGMVLPVTLGHEIGGEVVTVGSSADPSLVGKPVLVFPWIGCGQCLACREERSNDCMKMRMIGLMRNGGYATHVLVPDQKFLVDAEGLNLDTATPHTCSGLTVYSALKKLLPLREGEWLAVMGTGGLGLNGIAIARAMGQESIVAVDVDPAKLEAAMEMGATAKLDASRDDALEELREITGNRLLGVLDTFGGPATARLAVHALVKTGRYLVVGLHGGDFKMPLPWLPQKALTVRG
ncbi:MAG: alcohol dehydrogenase catalytic domain-containing protein, partial [Gammaproteobacteria bacterium]|nr:alcohol dehydrogenase catalytic domain-containing protein [Gammaproteobacteria bacterium]